MARGRSKNEVLVEFGGDADKLEREARKSVKAIDDVGDQARKTAAEVDRHTRDMSGSFDRLKGFGVGAGAAIGAGLAIGIGAALAGAKVSIEAFLESETAQFRQQFQLNQAGLGGFVDEFRAFNDELAKTTAFDDDAFAAAQAILARAFGTPEEIKRYTRLAADLSAVTGRDLASSAEALVKANAGSTRVLKDFGIDLGAVADEGADAASVFELLEQKVGGAAEQFGQTNAGQLEITKNRLGEIAEAIGEKLAPAFVASAEGVVDWAEDILAGAQDVGGALEDLGLDTSGLEQAFADVKAAYDQHLAQMWEDLKQWIVDNKDELQDFVDDLAYLAEVAAPFVGAAIDEQTRLFEGLATAIMGVVDALQQAVEWAVKFAEWSGAGPQNLQGVRAGPGRQSNGKPILRHAGTGGMIPGAPGEAVPFVGLAGERILSRHESGRTVLEIRSSGSRLDDLMVDLLARAADRAGGNLQLAVSRR